MTYAASRSKKSSIWIAAGISNSPMRGKTPARREARRWVEPPPRRHIVANSRASGTLCRATAEADLLTPAAPDKRRGHHGRGRALSGAARLAPHSLHRSIPGDPTSSSRRPLSQHVSGRGGVGAAGEPRTHGRDAGEHTQQRSRLSPPPT